MTRPIEHTVIRIDLKNVKDARAHGTVTKRISLDLARYYGLERLSSRQEIPLSIRKHRFMSPASSQGLPKRKKYVKPAFISWGAIVDLTRNGSGGLVLGTCPCEVDRIVLRIFSCPSLLPCRETAFLPQPSHSARLSRRLKITIPK